MWKKVLCLAVGILAIVVLVSGVVASVNADSANTMDTTKSGPPPGGPGGPGGPHGQGDNEMMTRVAQILNIDKQKLADAFKQAGSELAQTRMDTMFAKWVTDGKLTQAQADQYKAWLKAKPEGVPGFGMGSGDATKDTEMMSKMLTDSKITQAQYDAWKAWIAQKPAFELPKPERPAGAPAGPPCDNTTAPK
ncbi:MAG: hypothetical protein NTZ34_07495 [Chloroflexi bacterium]|nr:hypothetical protein [Chloroflexota bacterium]